MMARGLTTGVQVAWLGALHGAWRRFQRATADPARAQQRRLRALLGAHADTAYGHAHGFGSVTSVGEYQRRVPAVGWGALEPWVERVAAGETKVLTRCPVRMLERTGGTTAANKLVPYTDALLAEFSEATGAWLFDLHRAHPRLLGTRSYWSVSPVTRGAERTRGGLPIGFEDDTQYFGPAQRWALRRLMAVPPAAARIRDVEAWRRTTLHRLLACPDLGLISVWSPTFLTRLMEALPPLLDHLLAQLSPQRRRAIRRRIRARGQVDAAALWPRLAVISCWTEGASAHHLEPLRRWFPRVPVQPKGLLATEGVISIPLGASPGSVLAITSHFLEFEDPEHPTRVPRLAHELEPGARYVPLLTTGGGLYRYRLGDVVQCVGRLRATPLIRFCGRQGGVSDLCGEKLHPRRVAAGLGSARDLLRSRGASLSFCLVAPTPGPRPGYALFLETDADADTLARVRDRVEASFRQGHHYRHARDLAQLDPLQVHRVSHGWATFERALMARGARAGDIKPTLLDHRTFWSAEFGVG